MRYSYTKLDSSQIQRVNFDSVDALQSLYFVFAHYQ